jgi:hypothetical protein
MATEMKWYRVRLIFPFDILVQGANEDDAVKNSAKSFLVHEGEFLVHEATPKDLEIAQHNKKISPAVLVEREEADAGQASKS